MTSTKLVQSSNIYYYHTTFQNSVSGATVALILKAHIDMTVVLLMGGNQKAQKCENLKLHNVH